MPLTVLTVVRTRPEIIKLSCVIPALGRAFSDSGPLIEEASILGFPAVMLRDDHERPQGMDAGTVIMSGIAPQDVVDAVATTLDRHADGGGRPRIAADYDVDDVAWKVVNAIHSYPRYVDGVVWHKP